MRYRRKFINICGILYHVGSMSKEKKSKVDDINKLRKILDNPSDPNTKKLITDDENTLDSLRKRLVGETSKKQVTSDGFLRKFDSLEPKVTIHPKTHISPRAMPIQPKIETKIEPTTALPEFTLVSTPTPAPSPLHEFLFAAEELYEVEKVEILIPEFLEVQAKETDMKPQQTATTMKQDEPLDDEQNIPEWQPVHTTQYEEKHQRDEQPKQVIVPEFERIGTAEKNNEWEPLQTKQKTAETPVEFQAVEEPPSQLLKSKKEEREARKAEKQKLKQERRQSKLELKKLKIEEKEKERLAKKIAQERQIAQQMPKEKPVQKELIPEEKPQQLPVEITAFNGMETIDQKTAELLYKNGYFSLENLKQATVDDLVQIRGIKRKLAKQIKKEVEQKTKGQQEQEFIPLKQKVNNKKIKEKPEDITEWESYHVDELSEKSSDTALCTYEEFTLYKQVTGKRGQKKTTVHLFSKEKPDAGEPTTLPDGYEIAVNKKTKMPYLKKKKK